jgi:hypothetical protein
VAELIPEDDVELLNWDEDVVEIKDGIAATDCTGVGNTAATKPDPNCAVPIGLLAAMGPTI